MGAISFRNRTAFWLGVLASTAGVLLHLPMYIDARDMGYRMAGMSPDPAMLTGMALIIVGLALTAYGVIPARSRNRAAERVQVRALDDAPLTMAHLKLIAIMAVAVTIDVMKPTTLSFIAPGVTHEYALKSPVNPHGSTPEALLPLAGIAGTVIGSFIWGWLGDRVGRRASILLAGVLFTTTAICGAMPSFGWNLFMCFMMGIGVGGMIPIAFTLLAESVPKRHRGWVMVLIGGEIAVAYALTSWLSGALIPHYSWRIMWLIGLPTGLLVILLNRWIPESPRFLLLHGRTAEAQAVIERYGAAVIEPETTAETAPGGSYRRVFGRGLAGISVALVLLGAGIGLMTFGFQLWLPSNLQQLGFTQVTATRILRDSALIGLPLNVLAAWMYGFWSAKKTVVLLTSLTAAALVVFAIAGHSLTGNNTVLLYALLAIPLWGIGSVVGVLGAYSSEIYPTSVRGRGSGLSAGASKAGGVLIIALVAASVTAPSITTTALLGAIPLAASAAVFVIYGTETRRRGLEEITAAEPTLASHD